MENTLLYEQLTLHNTESQKACHMASIRVSRNSDTGCVDNMLRHA